jgi:hypothetical protein
MKSITLHNIDGPLAELIKSKAKSEGLSINKTVQKMLEESLGVQPRSRKAFRHDFEEFCGIWSDNELSEFNDRTEDLSEIGPGDWQ